MIYLSKSAVAVLSVIVVILMPLTVEARVDWEVSKAVQLEQIPIDVARAQGGDLTYLLTDQAKVLIYSEEGKLVGTVPVDPAVTDIAISAKGDQLYLINSARKTLQVIDISFIADFNVTDSPFMGPAEAKVVVAVFSDFQ